VKRRRFLRAGGAAVAVAALPAAAQSLLPAHDLGPLVAALTGGIAPERGGVEIDVPPLAENGNSIALRIRVPSPMTQADHVTALHVFAERNPRPLVAAFHLGPHSGRAQVATRIRLAGTQYVTVLASLSGGRYRLHQAQVVVTSSACLDETP
jgi:sulfur-oxidizing protein SoxY